MQAPHAPALVVPTVRKAVHAALTGVICDDAAERGRSILGLLSRSGFDVVGEVSAFAPLRETILRCRPTVAVVALSLVGTSGLEAVRVLRRDLPETQVVLLSAFTALLPEAVQAGARALVAEDDPQTLLAVLTSIAVTRGPSRPAPAVTPAARRPAPPAA